MPRSAKSGLASSWSISSSRNKTLVNDAELKGGVEHPLNNNDRINICNIELVYDADLPPKTVDFTLTADVVEITESAGKENPDFRTLEASRSSTMASAVRPEVKLKAILDITRSLSNELRIDTVAPKILDSLMEIFPGAERLFLMLQDPVDKATGSQGVQAPHPEAYVFPSGHTRGRSPHEHQPVHR